jgi:hypothetical protein
MQKWEVGSLVFFALIVVVVSASDRLSNTVIELLDSLFIQFIAVFGIIGLAYASPTVGIAAAVSFALLFVFRNNSHVQNIGVRSGALTPLSSYSAQNQEVATTKFVEQDVAKEAPLNLTLEQEVPDGQYSIDERRPVSSAELREFEYTPMEDTGKNEFYMVGQSIDEKGVIPASIKPWANA